MEIGFEKYRCLNRDVIKYIAMFTMLLNHIAQVFMEPGTWLFFVFVAIGYFTAITMCYFLVEGYFHTHSTKSYFLRLIAFAVISQIPFCFAFTKKGIIEFYGFNMIVTLCLCFVLIYINDQCKNKFLNFFVTVGVFGLSSFSDWAFFAPMFTLLFFWAGQSKDRLKSAFLIASLLFGGYHYIIGSLSFHFWTNIGYTILNMLGILISGFCIVYLYNGKRMEQGKIVSKWFFYLFYPTHLLILGLLRITLNLS